jgi:hypothetical protein
MRTSGRIATFGLVAASVALLGTGMARSATVLVDDNITAPLTTWTADNEYILTGFRFVKPGSTLRIEPGTVIRSEPNETICSLHANACNDDTDCADFVSRGEQCVNDPGTLVVARGARIEAAGTALKPIIFTNLDDDNLFANSEPDPDGDYANQVVARAHEGTWGGVIILGRGYVANDSVGGPNAAREVRIEGTEDRGYCTISDLRCIDDTDCTGGFDTCDESLGFYGDCEAASPAIDPADCDDDDSGFFHYVSIRYGGFELGSANEINGLTLGGVGRATSVHHVEVLQNQDDGVECFGGAVNLKNIVVNGVGDDGLDYDEGWRGNVQFYFLLQGRAGNEVADKGGEHDGGIPNTSEPEAIPDIWNATYVGLGGNGAGAAGTNLFDPAKAYAKRPTNTTLHIRDAAAGGYKNSAFLDWGGALALIEGDCGAAGSSGGHVTAPYLAPSGNCSNDTTIDCTDDAPCLGGGGVCVLHYLPQPGRTNKLEFEDNHFWCYGNPDPDGDAIPSFPRSIADATAAGGDGGLHCDPGFFPGLNQYATCADPLPIRELVRTPDIASPALPDPIQSIDPRPAPGSPLLAVNQLPPDNGFFTQALCRGAFCDDVNWAAGWTATYNLGYFPTPRECSLSGNPCFDDLECAIGETCDAVNVVQVDANIEGDVLWTRDNEYILTGVRFVKPGSTLTIEPGTVVRGEPNDTICSLHVNACNDDTDCADFASRGERCINDPGTLVVARGGRLIAEGNASQPIVFTNLDDDNVGVSLGRASGDYGHRDAARAISATWGGVVLLGRGYVANNSVAGPNPAREVRIEGLQDRGSCTISDARCIDDTDCGGGLDTCDLGLAFYGDCADTALSPDDCDDDDSGSLKYVSIRYGGFELGSANEINGLTLGGTGRSTELDSIEIYQNKDDCYEAFGGSALVKRIICMGVGDDGLDYDEGYRGSVQFFVNIQHFTGSDISDKGGEHDGGIPNTSLPEAQPAIYNATFIGLGGNGAPQDPLKSYAVKPTNTALHIRDNAATAYYNSFFGNFGGAFGLIEGACGANGTSGGHVDTPYAAPRGNCSNDTSIACTDDAPCAGGVCVFHYLPRDNQTFETEFENDTWWCFGKPFGDNDGQVKFPTLDATATAAGGDGGAHCDPGIFSNAALNNEYIDCGVQGPIRQLQRGFNPDPNLPNQLELLDIRARLGGPLFQDVRPTPNNGFFEPAPFRGAVGTDNWLTGWTNLSRLGYFESCSGGAGPAPDATTGLNVSRSPSDATVSWDPAALTGLTGLQYYDTLRFLRPDAATAVDFTAADGSADCIDSDDDDTLTVDTAAPPLGQVFIYRSRTVSDCGDAPLGLASDNTVVAAKACP